MKGVDSPWLCLMATVSRVIAGLIRLVDPLWVIAGDRSTFHSLGALTAMSYVYGKRSEIE